MKRRTRSSMRDRRKLDDLPELLTVQEVQEYLNVGRSLAYELARAHGIRLGRLVRVPRARIAKLMAA